MFITFFPNRETNDMDRFFIKTFEDAGFVPLVDGVNGYDLDILKRKYVTPHLFFLLDGKTRIYTSLGKDLTEKPSFVVYFNEDRKINDYEWECIGDYFNGLIHGKHVTDRVEKCVQNLKIEITTIKPMNDLPETKTTSFNYRSFSPDDQWTFHEITNHRGEVFTTSVCNGKGENIDDMMINFLSIDAFRKDILAKCFLKKLWDHLCNGEFPLEEFLEKSENCGGMVYQCPLEQCLVDQ